MVPTRFGRISALCLVCTIFLLALPSGTPVSAAPAGQLLVANKGDHTLSIIDPSTGKQIGRVDEQGITGHEIATSPDGQFAYVPLYSNVGVGQPGSDGRLVRVIDLTAQKIVGTIDFGHGVRPHLPVFNPKTGVLYVTTELDQAVSIIDPKTLMIVGIIPTGQPQSHMLAISHHGRRGYTANVNAGTVSVLDLESKALLATIPAAPHIQRISISPDDRWVITADTTAPRLVMIDAKSNAVSESIPLPGLAYGTAFTADGNELIVALPGLNQVGIINWKTHEMTHRLDVPSSPQAILIRPDGARAYVSCDKSGQVAVLKTADWTVERLIEAGPGADGLAWATSSP